MNKKVFFIMLLISILFAICGCQDVDIADNHRDLGTDVINQDLLFEYYNSSYTLPVDNDQVEYKMPIYNELQFLPEFSQDSAIKYEDLKKYAIFLYLCENDLYGRHCEDYVNHTSESYFSGVDFEDVNDGAFDRISPENYKAFQNLYIDGAEVDKYYYRIDSLKEVGENIYSAKLSEIVFSESSVTNYGMNTANYNPDFNSKIMIKFFPEAPFKHENVMRVLKENPGEFNAEKRYNILFKVEDGKIKYMRNWHNHRDYKGYVRSAIGLKNCADDAFYLDAAVYCFSAGTLVGCTCEGIMDYNSEYFSWSAPMTRARFVGSLGRMQKADNSVTSGRFADVKSDTSYSGYVYWAVNNGITQGVSDDKFAPKDTLNREQMATLVNNYLQI